jgi:hypothetical protein
MKLNPLGCVKSFLGSQAWRINRGWIAFFGRGSFSRRIQS